MKEMSKSVFGPLQLLSKFRKVSRDLKFKQLRKWEGDSLVL